MLIKTILSTQKLLIMCSLKWLKLEDGINQTDELGDPVTEGSSLSPPRMHHPQRLLGGNVWRFTYHLATPKSFKKSQGNGGKNLGTINPWGNPNILAERKGEQVKLMRSQWRYVEMFRVCEQLEFITCEAKSHLLSYRVLSVRKATSSCLTYGRHHMQSFTLPTLSPFS